MLQRISLFIGIFILAIATTALAGATGGGKPGPVIGSQMNDLNLVPLTDPKHAAYLGLEHPDAPFTLADIKADYILLEVFSMYCPFCQREAPNVNKAYELLEKKAKGKIKVVGLGVGNSQYEVDVFRKKFSVPFPLLPDSDMKTYKECFDGLGTPYFILLKGKDLTVVHNHPGEFGDAESFVKTILEKTAQ